MKPILFNTEMVRAILGGKKTVTRRLLRLQPPEECYYEGDVHEFIKDSDIIESTPFTGFVCRKCGFGVCPPHCKYPVGTSCIRPPYKEGDILYVRETFAELKDINGNKRYVYKSTDKYPFGEKYIVKFKWKPSIHMPKEAARIFLRVTGVRVERLKDIMEDPTGKNNQVVREGFTYGCDFIAGWNNTIKKSDIDKYGYYANPWVWVIEFERTSKIELKPLCGRRERRN